MDVDTIRPGADFTAAMDEALGSCRIVLVLIGQVWLAGTDPSGRRRITDPADHVVVEIATALRHSLPFVPVLAEARRCPRAPICRRCWPSSRHGNAVRVDHETFGRDSAVVVETAPRPWARTAVQPPAAARAATPGRRAGASWWHSACSSSCPRSATTSSSNAC